MSESLQERLSRVEMMADGQGDWDLSPNDRAALRTLLDLCEYTFNGEPPPAAEEHALVELPEGWGWGEDEDGFCAHNGPHNYVWVADGTLRHTGAFVPIAVVLAVIQRNAKVTT